MIGGILLLSIAVFAIAVMFGKADPKRVVWLVAILIFGPIVLLIGRDQFAWLWSSSSIATKIVMVILFLFIARAGIRSVLPNTKWVDALIEITFRSAVSVIAFPFRLCFRIGQLIFDRERRPRRLDPYRPAVGSAPPLERRREYE